MTVVVVIFGVVVVVVVVVAHVVVVVAIALTIVPSRPRHLPRSVVSCYRHVPSV